MTITKNTESTSNEWESKISKIGTLAAFRDEKSERKESKIITEESRRFVTPSACNVLPMSPKLVPGTSDSDLSRGTLEFEAFC